MKATSKSMYKGGSCTWIPAGAAILPQCLRTLLQKEKDCMTALQLYLTFCPAQQLSRRRLGKCFRSSRLLQRPTDITSVTCKLETCLTVDNAYSIRCPPLLAQCQQQ
eukprot:jgi/Chrzof1/6706/Cz19g06100.t1